jgi:hypothetical protein
MRLGLMIVSSFCAAQVFYKDGVWSKGIVEGLAIIFGCYAVIALVAMATGAIYLAGPDWLIARKKGDSPPSTEQMIDIVCLTALVGSIAIWFIGVLFG